MIAPLVLCVLLACRAGGAFASELSFNIEPLYHRRLCNLAPGSPICTAPRTC
jgi:hypothetical protein